jgi:predicted secreted protein
MNEVKRLAAVAMMVVTGICLCACSSPWDLEVDCAALYEQPHINKQVKVPPGKPLNITVCANPSTGYQWGEAVVADDGVISQENRVYVAPSGRRLAPGSAGKETWTFRSIALGQTTISLEYGQPWESGTKAEWTLSLTVVVPE